MLYVNDSAMPKAKNQYVCWMDIMGTKGKMENSVNTCAIFIFKFHTAILAAIKKGCQIKPYPVMDGVYITSDSIVDLQKAVAHIYSELGELFINEKNFHHKFLVKASVAYGPVIHGSEISKDVSREFADAEEYKQAMLLGLPMIQANVGEQSAPPFGVFIHESARAFCKDGEEPFGFRWWKWFLTQPAQQWDKDRIKSLAAAVDTYFSNCEELNMSLDYPLEKIKAHRKAAKEYFADINDAEESKDFSSLPAER